MEEVERCVPGPSCVDRPAAANSEEAARTTLESASRAHDMDSTASAQEGQEGESLPPENVVVSAAAAQFTRSAVTPALVRPVQDTFKVVTDQLNGNNLKVVPPYWRVLQTDVKMRWRGRQLLSVLAQEFRSRPVEYYKKVLEKGEYIFVNGAACRGSTVLCNGDQITHRTLETEFALPEAPVLVFHEDVNVLAAFKPPGLPVHPQGRYTQGSLLSILKTFHLQSPTEYLHPINRLDRVTAGVVVFAKSPSYARLLSAALPSAVKLYVAEVHGDFRTCVRSVKEIQGQRRSPPHPRTPCDREELPAFKDLRQERKLRAERTEVNPMCCSEDETYAKDVSGIQDSSAPTWDKPVEAAAETWQRSEKQPTGSSVISERVRRKELKRLAKNERQQKRMRTQQQQQKPKQQREESQENSLSDEECCSVEAESLSRQEATLRGIFEVVPFPGCTLCDARKGDAGTPAGEATAATHCQNTGSKAAAQEQAVGRNKERCCCADWLHVSARLQTSSRLVGRQLAVVWNEKRGKAASTFFKHLHYIAESDSSLIACVPRTGRTHQIRKHLQCLGATAIVSDNLYGESRRDVAEADGARSCKPQAATAGLAPYETVGEDERTPNQQRSSIERKVWASFSLEELRSTIGASMSRSRDGPAPAVQPGTQTQDGSNPDEQSEENGLAKFLQETSTTFDLRMSPAGDSVSIPYIIEEPWEIHLCSLGYRFTLVAASHKSNAFPHAVETKCRLSPVPCSPYGEGKRSLPDGDASPSNSAGGSTPPSAGVDMPSARATCDLKRVSISCPGAVWPSWAKPVTHLIYDNVWPFLESVEA